MIDRNRQNAFEFGRDLRVELSGWGRSRMEYRLERQLPAGPLEGINARQHFGENYTGAPEIASVVDILICDLLGRHIPGRAEEHSFGSLS